MVPKWPGLETDLKKWLDRCFVSVLMVVVSTSSGRVSEFFIRISLVGAILGAAYRGTKLY